MKECIPNSKVKVLSPVEKCWVESGFCAYLILRYDDPEKPQLEAMNSVRIIMIQSIVSYSIMWIWKRDCDKIIAACSY